MTTKADTSVKFGHSNIPDSPVLSGQAGALIALLDAFLLDGYCTRSVDSITVADGVATVTISAGVPYPDHAVIALAGASPAALNDEWRIYDVTGSGFKFNCPGIVTGSATGTITAKMAPVGGWEKAFADTNKAAYRSTDPLSNGFYLRVDDTLAQWARVRGYESMTAIDSGTNPFPTLEQRAATDYTWPKSSAANSTPRKWALVADALMLHACLAFSANANIHDFGRFGDILAFDVSDAWATEIVAQTSSAPSFPGGNNDSGVLSVSQSSSAYFARQRSGVVGAANRIGAWYFGTSQVGQSTVVSPKLFFSEVCVMDGTSLLLNPVRGVIPGLRVAINRPAESIDYDIHAVGDDLLFHVRAGLNVNNDLRYGAFALAPAGGWR